MTTRPRPGTDDRALSEVIAERLREESLTLAVAESCTGGLVAERLTDPPGASSFMLAGVVAYANEAKQRLLGVRAETIATHGAVSREVAREMATGARAVTGADVAVAVTGVAGPSGGTAEKPVGTVWLAASLDDRSVERSILLPGDRAEIRAAAARAALTLLDEVLRTVRGGT